MALICAPSLGIGNESERTRQLFYAARSVVLCIFEHAARRTPHAATASANRFNLNRLRCRRAPNH